MRNIVELVLNDEDILSGVEAISIVSAPAIEENFIALSKEQTFLAKVDGEKRILMGAALVPNKMIYRRRGEEEYYVFFTEETIRKVSELFLTKGNQNKATLEHEVKLDGLSVVESWVVEDKEHDKTRKYGLDVPLGTWMVSMKVYNDQVWEEFVKSGKVKGFSIEGYFVDKVNFSDASDTKQISLLDSISEVEAEKKLEELNNILIENNK